MCIFVVRNYKPNRKNNDKERNDVVYGGVAGHEQLQQRG